MPSRPLVLLCCLFLALRATAQAPIPPVIPWRAPTTLPTYLLQRVHQQYAARHAERDSLLGSAAGALAYRDSARARFRRVLGPLPARTPLRARVVGRVPQPGFRIEKIIYESTPHHHVTASLYVPAGRGRRPAALFLCGHEPASKATPSYQQTARRLAHSGLVVLVVDPISQGERMQLTAADGKPLTRGGTTEHTLLNAQATLLGHTLPAEELWDNVRGLDYLLSRPEVDATRVGCLGNSGGATQAAYLLGYDDRLQVGALCSYVAAGERNLTLTGPADGCVMLPGAGAAGLDVADWPLMFAPRPLLWLTGRYDFVDQTDMEAAYATTQRAYTALGRPGPNYHELFTVDDGHGISFLKRARAQEWFRDFLTSKQDTLPEGYGEAMLPEATLRCTATGQVSTAFKHEQSLAAIHLAEARALAARRPAYAPDSLAALLHRRLGIPRTFSRVPTVDIELTDSLRLPNGQQWQCALVSNLDTHEPPLPVRMLHPYTHYKDPTRLVVWLADQGMAAVLRDSAARLAAYEREDAVVVLADLRGLGETADPAAASDPKYYNQEYRTAMLALHTGRPLLAQRVADITTLLGFLDVNSLTPLIHPIVRADPNLAKPLPCLLRADGRAALAALHAAVLLPHFQQVQVSGGPPSFQYFLENPTAKDAYSYVLPGVLRYYDVPDLRRALGARLLP